MTGGRAGVVVIRDGRIALIERHRGDRHYWAVPGGSIEPGETVEEAALREAHEELHADVVVGRLVIEADFPAGTDTPRHQWYFEATVGSDDIRMTGPETDPTRGRGTYEAVWVPLEDLAGLTVLPRPVARAISEHGGNWPAAPVMVSDA
ncbi:MAG TPA: NUDIX domain-containing protein [Acidimicrobiales bacterium]|nr:NUDIX domain-containing protein [Acidimicrobiales bacterium]